jgi:pimeloyl-ACP methyl ester carboxylesterase
MTTFVLCHGGGMGGWVWRWVAPLLQQQGHRVLTPTFTGFGERVHLLRADTTPDTHVQDIVNVLHYEDVTDAVLVGHSYAGTILPGVKQRAAAQVARVVLLDAVLVHSNEAVGVAMGYMPAAQAAAVQGALARGEAPPGSGVHEQQREMAKSDPYDMPREREAWLLAHLSDMPLAAVVTPVAAGAETLGTDVDYLAVTKTVMHPIMHDRARALGWRVAERTGDHAILVGQPEVTADYILACAAR